MLCRLLESSPIWRVLILRYRREPVLVPKCGHCSEHFTKHNRRWCDLYSQVLRFIKFSTGTHTGRLVKGLRLPVRTVSFCFFFHFVFYEEGCLWTFIFFCAIISAYVSVSMICVLHLLLWGLYLHKLTILMGPVFTQAHHSYGACIYTSSPFLWGLYLHKLAILMGPVFTQAHHSYGACIYTSSPFLWGLYLHKLIIHSHSVPNESNPYAQTLFFWDSS
jgi:hypothetical protein